MSSTSTQSVELRGARVLLVEDEPAIAMLVEDMLDDLGCSLVGPAANIARALELAKAEAVDVAVLDVNVAGEPIYAVVEALVGRGVPFVFSTGYGASGIQENYRDRPILPKPFTQGDLERTLREALSRG